MTLCIAALCRDEGDNYVVLSSDKRVETSTAGDESEIKVRYLTLRWTSLVAGTLHVARELADRYAQHLASVQDILTQDNAHEELYVPLAEMRESLREQLLQKNLSVSLSDYRKHGREWFSEDVQRQMDYDLAQVEFDAQLLLVGLVGSDLHVYRVHAQNHLIERCERFAAIGSGANVAEMVLYQRQHSPFWTLPRTLYAVYEAQRIGQIAPGVGRETHQYVLSYDPDKQTMYPIILFPNARTFLDEQFEALGPRPIPLELKLPFGSLFDFMKRAQEKAQDQPSPFTKAVLGALSTPSTEN
jgi:ATP-dependent protease HslVU (ClpYQ) peptidase subunit